MREEIDLFDKIHNIFYVHVASWDTAYKLGILHICLHIKQFTVFAN